MTDAKQKPREFWVGADDRDYFESFISTKNPKDMSGSDDYMYLKDRPLLHLVEKKEYDQLLVRIARTKSAAYYALLEMSAWLGVPEHKRMKQINFLMENVNYCADVDIKDDEAKNE